MDWFRALLILAVAVFGWNIIFQWNEDYGQATRLDLVTEESNSPVSISPSTALALNMGDYSAEQGTEPVDSINQGLAPVTAGTEQQTFQKPEKNPRVNIRTDVYVGEIDLVGGDLVRLALTQYPMTVEEPDAPFLMFISNDAAKYVAESGIIGVSANDLDTDTPIQRPLFIAAQQEYIMTGQSLIVPLKYTNPMGVQFEKRYVFTEGSYEVKIEYEITNPTEVSWVGRPYGRFRRSNFADPGEVGGFGLPTFLGVAYWDPEEKFTKIKFDDLLDVSPKAPYMSESLQGGWIGVLQHYFVAAWAPDDASTNLYRATYNQSVAVPGGIEYIIEAVSPQIVVASGESQTSTQTLYVGPKIQDNLKSIAHGLNLVVDYGPLFFVSDFLMWLMKAIYTFVGNYGVSIILLTVFVKLCLFYPSAKAYKSMAKMREMQPKMLELKKKYGDDRQKMSAELMKLYQKEGVNPLGGCLPMLIQMPVFLALYWALLESVELRQAPFLFWIHDLSIMDPYFVLPLIMGVSMWFQQKLNPEPPDPMQAKIMRYMPIGMTFLFLFFPAGLVLYWVTNNLLSIAQQTYITKKMSK